MNKILGCVFQFCSKFMQFFRKRPPFIGPTHQLVLVSDKTFRNDDGLKHEPNKTEFNNETQYKADFQGDYVFLRQFIDLTPTVEVDDIASIRQIGDKSVSAFIQLVQSLEGYEQLENNNDGFSFWIKYVYTQEKFQIQIMRYTYSLNTTLDNYLAFISDIDQWAKLNNSIDCYENVWNQDEYGILYLRYKKILFMDPIDYLFIKKDYIDRKEDLAIQILKSINYEYSPKNLASKSTTRGLLLLGGSYIRQIDYNKLEITCYSESNMKLQQEPFMTKITKVGSKNSVKKIIKQYRDHFQQN